MTMTMMKPKPDFCVSKVPELSFCFVLDCHIVYLTAIILYVCMFVYYVCLCNPAFPEAAKAQLTFVCLN